VNTQDIHSCAFKDTVR